MQIPITLLHNNDGSFTVVSSAFNFITEGETMEDALKNAKEAMTCHIEGLKKSQSIEEKEYLDSFTGSMNTFVSL